MYWQTVAQQYHSILITFMKIPHISLKLIMYLGTMLIQVLARVTKFAWFDDQSHQEITDNVSKFLEVFIRNI